MTSYAEMLNFCPSSPLVNKTRHGLSTSSPRRRRRVYVASPTMLEAGPRLGAPVLDSEGAKNTAAFEQWLEKNEMYLSKKATWGRPKVPIAIANKTTDDGEPSGRGLVAIKGINQGECLFQVPIDIILTKERALQSIPELPNFVDDYMAIAAHLIKERSLGDKSFWKPYLDILPRDEEMIPLFRWTPEELAMLNGSPSLAAAKNLTAKLDREFKELDDTLFSLKRDVFPEAVFTREAWYWAFALLFSRAIMLTSENRIALVPYADLLNHNPFCSSFIDVGESSLSGRKHVELYADRPYGQMSQVFVSYGPKSNSLLLLLYGFVVDRNPYDSVDITVALRKDDPLWERKSEYLRESGVKSVTTFPLYRDRYPMELIEYLRFCFAGEAEMNDADFGDFVSIENETMVADALIAACREALNSYPQTIEDDEELMADRRMYMMLDQKYRWAIRQRLAEKRILRRTMLNIEKEIADPTFMFVTSGE